MGLGWFNVFILGTRFGVCRPDATLLACSFDAVGFRIRDEGVHTAPFATDVEAATIAQCFRHCEYGDEIGSNRIKMSKGEFKSYFVRERGSCAWIPDGDAAFDDGSYVLHFDIQDQVRLIGFKSHASSGIDPLTLRDMRMPADEYYNVLRVWYQDFESHWRMNTNS
jgi:hypothetical protein